MDRSLWLLLQLRGLAWVRRWRKNVRSLKGALLAVVGSLIFLPALFSTFFARGIRTAEQVEAIRHYGAFGFLAMCVLQVLFSAGERAIYYAPAEINFLFCGPYRPRQLLLYKIVTAFSAAFVLAFFLTFMSAAHAAWLPAAFLALFLGINFLFLFLLIMGLLMSLVGVLAFDRLRQIALGAVAVGLLVALATMGQSVREQGFQAALDRFLETGTARIILLPFQPFVMAFTAQRLWPDLLLWGAACLAVDLTLMVLVLAANAQFLETSLHVSSRIYARIRRFKRGETLVSTGSSRLRWTIPMLPWWGGIGPNLWRQLVTLTRSGQKLFSVAIMFVLPLLSLLFVSRGNPGGVSVVLPALTTLSSLALFAPTLIGFDFRTDLTRMEDLKTLPVRPTALVVGQLVTPVLVLTSVEWIVLGLIYALSPDDATLLLACGLMLPPVNFLLVGIDNLYFLWFPFRLIGMNPLDFQTMGRHTLLIFAKIVTLAVVLGVAAAIGALPYFALGHSWKGAILAAWFALIAIGLGVVPLLAHAFVQFDVTESVSE